MAGLPFPGTAAPSNPTASSTKHSRSASTADQAPSLPKKLKQDNLNDHAYKGVDMPFNSSEIAAVQAQALRAAISANLSFRVYEDPEVIKLFWMMRTMAPQILPSVKSIGGRLLNDAAGKVELKMDKLLHRKSIGLA
jgi:hypothetical protein